MPHNFFFEQPLVLPSLFLCFYSIFLDSLFIWCFSKKSASYFHQNDNILGALSYRVIVDNQTPPNQYGSGEFVLVYIWLELKYYAFSTNKKSPPSLVSKCTSPFLSTILSPICSFLPVFVL